MTENCNPYASPSEPRQASAAPVEPKPWWTKNFFIFAAMMLAAYLILPALLLVLGGTSLGELGGFGFQTPIVLLVFPWPLLLVYGIVLLIVLSTTSSVAIRSVLGALALVVYTVAVFFWIAFAIAG